MSPTTPGKSPKPSNVNEAPEDQLNSHSVCTKAKHITSEDVLSHQLAPNSGLTGLNFAQRSSVSLSSRSDAEPRTDRALAVD